MSGELCVDSLHIVLSVIRYIYVYVWTMAHAGKSRILYFFSFSFVAKF